MTARAALHMSDHYATHYATKRFTKSRNSVPGLFNIAFQILNLDLV